ncbi:MAG: transglycosylase domain-containing protein, partial [Cyanobium sp.]
MAATAALHIQATRALCPTASAVTQQLARTVFLSQDRTILRKLKEAALAGKLERQLSKEQILTEYLNVVYLGSGAYGVADAAWIYFSKNPAQLTL